MKFTIKRQDFVQGEALEIERSALSGRLKVRLNGEELAQLKEKGHPFDVTMKDRSHRKLFVRARWLDPVPVVLLDSEEILLAEKLRWIDYMFGCFPALMFLVYGPLPTIIAFFMLMGNFRILRTKMRPTIKWSAIYALDIVLFWIVALLVKFVWNFSAIH